MSTEKIFRKEIEDKVRQTIVRQVISVGEYRIKDKISANTFLKNKTLEESIFLLKEGFEKASKELNIPIEKLRFEKSSISEGIYISGLRFETNEELEQRIQGITDYQVYKLRKIKNNKNRVEYNKKKRILALEKELNELKK